MKSKKTKIETEIDSESLLSIAYQKFELLFDKINSIEPANWTVTQSLVYICVKYHEKFNTRFVLSYKDSPSKSPEYKLTTRLWMMLGARKGDGQLVKDYIDWFYKNYSARGKRFTSLGAIIRETSIAEFQKGLTAANKPTRATKLPLEIKRIANLFPETRYMQTWGDLAVLKESFEDDSFDKLDNHKEFFELVAKNNIDISVIKEFI